MVPEPLHIATVCTTCVAGQAGLADTLASALAGLPFEVRGAECMSACTRPSSVAFRAPGKTAYLFGDLAEADMPDLVTFARLYAASADGTFVDARPLGALRLKAVARIPG